MKSFSSLLNSINKNTYYYSVYPLRDISIHEKIQIQSPPIILTAPVNISSSMSNKSVLFQLYLSCSEH